MKNVPVVRELEMDLCHILHFCPDSNNEHADFKALWTFTSFEVTAESENLYLSHL